MNEIILTRDHALLLIDEIYEFADKRDLDIVLKQSVIYINNVIALDPSMKSLADGDARWLIKTHAKLVP